jgi:hypothetical protein
MPVYNGSKYLRYAIDSILKQTYIDFELIIINDGSTDNSVEIIGIYKDFRIISLNNLTNTGLANVRNQGIDISRGEYIAWLDCDDVSCSTRLEKQVELLEKDKSLGLCGTWVETIGSVKGVVWKYPVSSNILRSRMLFDDPFATSSVMLRKSAIQNLGTYFDLEYPPAEDYELWERISQQWKVANIPEVLTLYRIHVMQTSVINAEKQRASVWEIQNRLLKSLGIDATEQEKEIHLDIGVNWCCQPDIRVVKNAELWLLKIETANRLKQIFPENGLRSVLAERWMLIARSLASRGFIACSIYHRSQISHWADKRLWRTMSLFAKCIHHS